MILPVCRLWQNEQNQQSFGVMYPVFAKLELLWQNFLRKLAKLGSASKSKLGLLSLRIFSETGRQLRNYAITQVQKHWFSGKFSAEIQLSENSAHAWLAHLFLCWTSNNCFQIDSGEDAQEEFGWKLVHGDVFRPPRKGMLLSVLLGSGTQILCMTGITLVRNLSRTWPFPIKCRKC